MDSPLGSALAVMGVLRGPRAKGRITAPTERAPTMRETRSVLVNMMIGDVVHSD